MTVWIGPNSLTMAASSGVPGFHGRRTHHPLEALVLDRDGTSCWHYHRTMVRADGAWGRRGLVSSVATGPASIASLPTDDGCDLHALVPEASGIVHYTSSETSPETWGRRGEFPGEAVGMAVCDGVLHAVVRTGGVARHLMWMANTWNERTTLGPVTGDVALYQDRSHLLASLATGEGVNSYELRGDVWTPTPVASELESSAAGLPRGYFPTVATALATCDLGSGWLRRPGWPIALVQEGGCLYQYQRETVGKAVRWRRAGCLRFDPADGWTVVSRGSSKLDQISGEKDSQPGRTSTLSTSRSQAGVIGTDLGVHVRHGGRSFLLFGDTHWDNPKWGTLDSIAEVHFPQPEAGPFGLPGEDADPAALPTVAFHGSPLRITQSLFPSAIADGGRITSREYDVPLDALSLDDENLCIFYTSNHFANHQVMGRSVVTRVADPSLPISGVQRRRPIDLDLLGTFSDHYFVNVSVQRRGDVVYLWGSGSYRADDLRVARMDLADETLLAELRNERALRRPIPGVAFWDGAGWVADETAAAPVCPGAFGEISVRWVDELQRYVLLAMDAPEDPMGPGVTMRTATAPQGPWSPRAKLFDWCLDGQCATDASRRFIRAFGKDDPVGDDVFNFQASSNGAGYAPYLFDTRQDGGDVVIRYTLSTWNPYQAVLMEHRLSPIDLAGLR